MSELIRSLLFRLLLVPFPFVTISCIHDSDHPDCADQYTVTLTVKDKNYDNIDQIPELTRINENMPFAAYVRGISYKLEDISTRHIYASGDYQLVGSQEMTHKLIFNDVPAGRYLLTTLGNLPASVISSGTDSMLVVLHKDNIENTDAYIGTDTLDLTDTPNSATSILERLKGNLLVVCKKFPAGVNKIVLQVDSVYRGISERERTYAQATYATQSFSTQGELLQMYLAPTVMSENSSLTMSIYTSDSSVPAIVILDTKFTIKRNMVTEFMVDFNAEMEKIVISIRINGVWEKINEMHIDIE